MAHRHWPNQLDYPDYQVRWYVSKLQGSTGGRPANELIRRTGSARRGDPWTITLEQFGRNVGRAHRPG